MQTERSMILPAFSDARGSVADFSCPDLKLKKLELSLPGAHQLTNALTALSVIGELRRQGITISDTAVRDGCRNVFWPARLEWNRNVLIDGAHNVQGVTALADFTEAHLAGRKIIMLIGVLTEKLTEEMIAQIRRIGSEAITVTPDYASRAMPADAFAEVLKHNGIRAAAAPSIEEGAQTAIRQAGTEGTVIAFGSLYFVGRLRTVLGLRP